VVQQTLVFISHTQSMRTHPAGQSFVEGAEEAVNSVDGAKAFHMGFFPAADEAPAAYSLRQLEKADVFLAVIGFDAGSRVPSDPRSYTELEFDGATELRRERLVFLLRPDSAYLEGVNPRRVAPEQARFRHRLETSGATVAYFDDVGDLKYKVRQAVEQSVRTRAARGEGRVGGRPAGGVAAQHGGPVGPGGVRGAIVGSVRTVRPPAGRTVARVLSALLVAGLLAVAGLGLLVATAVRGTFPPWRPQDPCDGVTATARAVPVPFPGPRPVGALEVVVRNDTDRTVHLPAARDVTARGATGEQYVTDVPPGDQEWFFGVQVGQRSTVRLLLGVSASSPVTDRVRVVVSGVRGAGGPLTRCRITVPPVKVTISPGT